VIVTVAVSPTFRSVSSRTMLSTDSSSKTSVHAECDDL
jgi:hypothetical protein